MASAIETVRLEVAESVAVKQAWDEDLQGKIVDLAWRITAALRAGGKVVLFGNGGSAADAQHIAAEFVGRYRRDRPPLRAMALTVNTSVLTAIANDYEANEVFARQVRAHVDQRDVVIGISTSGNSANVWHGFCVANEIGAFVVLLTGGGGAALRGAGTLTLAVPSTSTPRIQESHILIGHIVVGLVEEAMFGEAEAA